MKKTTETSDKENHRTIIVKATRYFTVGPDRQVAIKKGSVREVKVDDDGYFSTKTENGGFFGYCHLDDGWEIINKPMPAQDGHENPKLALEWWNNLSDYQRVCAKYRLDGNTQGSLTEDQIEMIYVGTEYKYIQGLALPQTVTPALSDKEINEMNQNEHENYSGHKLIGNKSNQKQFKEFNPELFKAYINKFSQEDKISMLQVLIDDLNVRALVDKSLRS